MWCKVALLLSVATLELVSAAAEKEDKEDSSSESGVEYPQVKMYNVTRNKDGTFPETEVKLSEKEAELHEMLNNDDFKDIEWDGTWNEETLGALANYYSQTEGYELRLDLNLSKPVPGTWPPTSLTWKLLNKNRDEIGLIKLTNGDRTGASTENDEWDEDTWESSKFFDACKEFHDAAQGLKFQVITKDLRQFSEKQCEMRRLAQNTKSPLADTAGQAVASVLTLQQMYPKPGLCVEHTQNIKYAWRTGDRLGCDLCKNDNFSAEMPAFAYSAGSWGRYRPWNM